MKQYVNFHTHSIGSMLDGHGKPERYFERAKELGMPGIGISDHGNLHMMLDWYKKGLAAGVKPILGIEAYQARKSRFDRDPEERAGQATSEWGQRGPYHLTVVAKNNTGYKNLIQLSSDSFTEGFFVKGRIDHQLIDKYSDGLIILSGCLSGEVQQALLRGDYDAALKAAATMQSIVGKENYFIEIMDHGIPEEHQVQEDLVRIAKAIGAKIIPTCDCHYVHKHEHTDHDVMLCVSTNARVNQESRFRFDKEEFYLKSYDEMALLFPDEWLANSMAAFEMIDVDIKFGEYYFPQYPDVPADMGVDGYLENLVWEGAIERYGDPLPAEVEDRIKHELGVVQRMGFQEYFLVVWDLVNWAKKEGIRVGYGRGSAAGSILSYCLRITNLDPIKFGLLFERFLVEGRKSMPDIDLDFDDRYRLRVIDYAKQRYGMDHVAHICTFNSIGAKQAIRDAARVLDYDYLTGDALAKLIPPPVLGKAKTLAQSLDESKELYDKYEKDAEAKHIIDAAKGLEGIYRQQGIHAAGIIISRGPVKEHAPVMRKGDDQPLVAQWTMYDVEDVGLLKVDFLALSNLAVIDITIENILGRTGTLLDIDNITLEDEKTYAELRKGNSMGIFQVESPGMREMMLSLQPTDIYDIMALISLYRPGPMGIVDKMYINRKHGRERVTFAHESLEQVLDKTYGLMIYQEDVLNVLRVLAGYSAGDADDIRKVMGKKLMDQVDKYEEPFIEGCRVTNQVKPELSLRVWNDIKKFAGYGFNRAHAASYAMVSYVTAYLKFHYPSEYMAALLTTFSDKPEQLPVYLYECSKLDLKVLPPSVEHSIRDFKVASDTEILYGFTGIKGIGPAIINNITEERDKIDFSSLHSYLRDCNREILNKATLEHLARSGAFDDLAPGRVTVTADKRKEILDIERNELGIYVTEHPLQDVWQHLEGSVSCTIKELETVPVGQQVTLGGLISKAEKRTTKRGQIMYTLRFEDMTGNIEIVVFPREAVNVKDGTFKEGDICLISGQVSRDGDDEHYTYKLFYNKIEAVDPRLLRGGRPIKLRIERPLEASEVERINGIIKNKPGDSVVYLEVVTDHSVTFAFKQKASYEIKETLEQILKIGSVHVVD